MKEYKNVLSAICKNCGHKGRNGIEDRVKHPERYDRNGNLIRDYPGPDSSPSVISL